MAIGADCLRLPAGSEEVPGKLWPAQDTGRRTFCLVVGTWFCLGNEGMFLGLIHVVSCYKSVRFREVRIAAFGLAFGNMFSLNHSMQLISFFG